ncbi:chemotaxis protein CheR [Lampropedia aestuarii]|uniref:Chemotaxis protein methyltransferase n=1 Tax=Lampropedia aestuarii TaxID=2562762 RepID=A0A4S5BK30_9BURK|nr:CheR family methyltransferase [Lampropedia aestuarii]THJ31293.1 chemotaxis protein CheR [Lampropedia aestuarii]
MTSRSNAATANSAIELDYQDQDFQRIRSMIFAQAGIYLHEGKRAMVFNRLSKRLRQTQQRSFSDYLDALDCSADSPEWEFFINALTTNLTAFFREAHHFDMLREMLQNKPAKQAWSIWSGATASGEEAYSIAITAAASLPAAQESVRIIASDINTHTLARASQGIYPLSKVEHLGDGILKNYFQRGTGERDGLVRIQPWLTQWIAFTQINLQSHSWPTDIAQLNAIFCRNVLIYFQETTQRQVLERLHHALAPGGYLFMGHAEHLGKHEDLFKPIGKTVYAKR